MENSESGLLTSIYLFVDNRLLLAFVHFSDVLHLSYRTSDVAIRIHNFLEGVILPPKDVVTVIAKAETIEIMLVN
jgi:hypothetical protein